MVLAAWLSEVGARQQAALARIAEGREPAALVIDELLAEHVLPGIRAQLGCDSVSYNEIALSAQRMVRFLVDPPEVAEALPVAAWEAHAHEHPVLARTIGQTSVRSMAISDLLTVEEFHALALYTEFYRHGPVEDQLSLQIATTPASVIALAANRSEGRFGPADHDCLDVIGAWLGPVVAALTLAGTLRDLATAGGSSLALVFVRDGIVTELTSGAADLARRWGLEVEVGGPLPALEPLEREGHRLEVQVHAQEAPGLRCLQLVEHRPDLASRAAAVGLTARELQVLRAAGSGATSAQIARDLALSVRTVDKHLQGAYRALGVVNRTQAVAWLTDPLGHSPDDPEGPTQF